MYLNLRLVASVDFRRGVPRHYDELRARKLFRDIREDETILLISQTGQQLAFVFREVALPGGHGHEDSRAIGHFRIQLDKKRTWNPAMLSYYAEQAGIELAHVKRFEDHLAHLREERAE